MDLKIIILASVSLLVQGGSISQVVPVLAKIVGVDPAPQYTFAYDVPDALTGHSKAQFETRNGDVVKGIYSLIEADGTRRTVDYTADPVNGFNAVANREPAIAVAPVVTKTVPVVTKAVAPAPIFIRAVVSSPIVPRKIVSPVAVASAVVSGRVIVAPGGFPAVDKISKPKGHTNIATIAAPLTYAAAGYAI